ncbi:diguanylate cyclase (GGDEF)-like protein [Actinoplanes lutulentus]|uniref:diguanylate cyclase n=1 Tax=Actinoplanes lutulentus TaxID=1287878 RepID=UPI0015EC33AF|nr:diguanylate cyclase [Actinoplanes lutulentus]MBB2940315.1 diguanylate cyclase (GGDEF)-like protein [Actinoplanes lutulentus]
MRSDRAEELLYDSDRTRVVRISTADGTRLVRKQPLGPGAAERLSNELEVLRRLGGVEGTPQLANEQVNGSLTLLDANARTLSEMDAPWASAALIDLAHGLALLLADVHRHGVIHRDVSPANILISHTPGQTPTLIDYELSTLAAQDLNPVPEDGLAGTLPYLAPEQTGRTGRPVDHRSDLYALGATLYELATGAPPFGRDREPLKLIHDHLAGLPVPPAEVNPEVPAALSGIILRLLRKEPDLRYQSGEGLAYDLALLRAKFAAGLPAEIELGARDFPMRLAPPSRLIGRESQLAALRSLLDETVAGHSTFTLITGPPGVGKTALVAALRPAIAAAGGRFVAGKFDQYRHDLGGDAVREAFDVLGSQLLTEPDEVVAELRVRLREALGSNSGLASMMMPPFRTLLGVEPEEPGDADPRQLFARLRAAVLAVLRTVASGTNPVVFFLDDLQWAAGAAFRFLDDVLDQQDLPGLLVLGAYREEEVDETHPLAAVRSRLRREREDAAEVRLENLAPHDLVVMIAEMLRLPEAAAAPLAVVLAERTGGNPFDTVELLNALRREGVLVPDGDGWRWDEDTVRRFVGHGDVVDLLGSRIEALPEPTRGLIEVMACLGGEVGLEMLSLASGHTAGHIVGELRPAAQDGLVVIDETAVRFRHDRVQQAAFGKLDPAGRGRLSLTLARRLTDDPLGAPAAAPLYLAGVDALLVPKMALPGEKPAAAAQLVKAASAAKMVANHAAREVYLAAALRLLDKTDLGYADVRAEWHSALCGLARFDEADQVFAELAAMGRDPVWMTGPVAEQLGALTNRRMLGDALPLGLGLLADLGVDVPGPEQLGQRIGAGMAAFYGWLPTAGDPGSRPEMTDPRLLAVSHLINKLVPAAFFADQHTMAWLVAEAGQLWAGHGPCASLTGVLGNIGVVTIAGGGEHRAAYQALLHILATGEHHGYEPETSQAKFLHALATLPWFEPLENGVRMAHEARDGLLRGGDLRNALYTYYTSVPQMLGSAANLDTFSREAQDAWEFGERIGAGADIAMFVVAGGLVRAMRGETSPPGALGFDEDTYLESLAGNDAALAFYTACRSLTAMVFRDDDALIRHSKVAVALLPSIPGTYIHIPSHIFHALGAAVRLRRGHDDALGDLDTSLAFLTARAADQPGNFRHLQRFVEAVRAAALGAFREAAAAFDAAMTDAATAGRSWHSAVITERAALFYLDNGLDHVGERLLAESVQAYARWGAPGKVHELKRAYPSLGSALAGGAVPRATTLSSTHSINLSTEVIDLMAVLEAARVLSSETELERLRIRVQDVLRAMTGATAVHVLLWDSLPLLHTPGWFLPADGDRPMLSLAEAGGQGLLPLTAIRYAERTREPMLVDDVTLDGRVGRDPYLTGLDHCSLLVVPVLSQGQPRAMLVLENRLNRRAFSIGRLDAVQLIAGQLAVSLENAQIYASLERKVAERTEELAEANLRLELLTVTDPLTGLPNRRKLTTFLDDEWLRSQRTDVPIGVAMIDIDNFKKYNDHYGHQGGDECLRLVAAAIRDSVRVTDLVARYGGEEFCVVMPGTSAEHALLVADRACKAVSRLRQPHALADNGIVTISVGVTSGSPSTAGDAEQLTKLADEALYEAKRGGRNRVVSG